MPSTVRSSSVDNKASSLESFATRPPTKSNTRRIVFGGQFSEAVSKRLAKAADRQGGHVLDEKTISRATNSISATEPVGASIVCIKLRGRMMEYNCVIKSPRSMLIASPDRTCQSGTKEDTHTVSP